MIAAPSTGGGGFALRGIDKAFGAVQALRAVSVSASPGQLHALIGENGAGKTTLMRILAGLEQADRGEIEIGGRTLATRPSPREAQQAGAGLVPQHPEVVAGLSVLENLTLGWEISRRGVVTRSGARSKADELAERLGFGFRWEEPAERLGLGDRQRLELLKVLWREASVVVFDEPTTVLTAAEVRGLFKVMRRLVEGGGTVVFITHKLDEVRQIADDVTVLRRGRVVARVDPKQISERELARAMIGELIDVPAGAARRGKGEVRLALRDACTEPSMSGGRPLRNVTLALRAGEIVGVAGIDGNGQSELYEVILGLRRLSSGEITLDREPISRWSVIQRRSAGVAAIPPDRLEEGINRLASLWENATAAQIASARAGRWGVVRRRVLREEARMLLAQTDVRGELGQPAGTLSGGNIQRLIVGRELAQAPRVLVAAHPTRGVDVRGLAYIHQQLLDLRSGGCAILLISTDLDELAQLSDRVVVMADGRLVGEYLPGEADPEQIGLLMSGQATGAAA